MGNDFLESGISYYKKGQHDLAICDFNKAIEQNPRDYKAYVCRGLAYMANRQCELAIADFSEVIRQEPAKEGVIRVGPGQVIHYDIDLYYEAHYQRGLSYDYLGQYDLAISDFSRAIGIKRSSSEAYLGLGMTYKLKEQYDRAIISFNKAIEINPRENDAYLHRGDVYRIIGQFKLAINDLNIFISICGDADPGYLARGICYANLGDRKNALADFNKVRTTSANPQLLSEANRMKNLTN